MFPRRFVLRALSRDNDWLRLTSDDQRQVQGVRWEYSMRRFLLAAVMFGAASCAQAADMPDYLRGSLPGGSAPIVNWRGFYLGGQGGYGSSDENLSGSNSNLLAALIADDIIQEMGVAGWNLNLGKDSARAPGYGAFAGYNWQWDDVVAGLEMSYLHGSFGGKSTAFKELVSGSKLSDGNFHDVSVTSSSAIAITDMATFRARAAYAYGCFLPYLFGGLALGNANITRSVLVTDGVNSTTALGPFTTLQPLFASDAVHNHLVYGYTAGLGVDINLIGGLFMRAEWEYVRFTAAVDTNINTVRAGLGYKF
jgi:outer membrane immunogenic protein